MYLSGHSIPNEAITNLSAHSSGSSVCQVVVDIEKTAFSMLATVPNSCGGALESASATTLSAPGTQRISVVNSDKNRCRC